MEINQEQAIPRPVTLSALQDYIYAHKTLQKKRVVAHNNVCSNLNHINTNAPVRYGPMCGEIMNIYLDSQWVY